jgi:hypothetical protein
MSNYAHADRIEEQLKVRGLIRLSKYLPTPDYVQEIIILTNDGKLKEAARKITSTSKILELVSRDLSTEDREWYESILVQLKKALETA